MAQVLYRSYRSKRLSEIVGQEHITTALNNALQKGIISHAYLFTGPRGVGKTSIARILAHEVNGFDYTDERQYLDIIEIDAASNRRIDEIRDLRDRVHVAPTIGKYKVYIIDEVHMLTKEAFNALLKTLEEPPAHVIFILATTETHKLPETIISRTQRYAFKPVEQSKVVAHLRFISKQEKIKIDDAALELIAEHGEGSFRDSISMLDQIRSGGKDITLDDVQKMLGLAPVQQINDLITELSIHNAAEIVNQLKKMTERGYEPSQIAKQLGEALRQTVIQKTSTLEHATVMKLLAQLVSIPNSPNPRVTLEIALLDAAFSDEPTDVVKTAVAKTPVVTPNKVMPEEVVAAPAIKISSKEAKEAVRNVKIEKPKTIEQPVQQSSDSNILLDDKCWEEVLSALKQKHNTLFGIVKNARPHFEPGKLTLEVTFNLHLKKINEVANKDILDAVIRGVAGGSVQISCIKGEGKPAPVLRPDLPPADGEVVFNAAPGPNQITEQPASTEQDPTISTISNIFGGAELLES